MAEQRNARREAVRMLTRLGRNLATPQRIDRDCGKESMEAFLSNLLPQLDTDEEREEAAAAIQKWTQAAGVNLFLGEGIPSLPTRQPSEQLEGVMQKRISCCDLMLTFNRSFVPEGVSVADWFPEGGKVLLADFLVPW